MQALGSVFAPMLWLIMRRVTLAAAKCTKFGCPRRLAEAPLNRIVPGRPDQRPHRAAECGIEGNASRASRLRQLKQRPDFGAGATYGLPTPHSRNVSRFAPRPLR
jgi:hypothetical protein